MKPLLRTALAVLLAGWAAFASATAAGADWPPERDAFSDPAYVESVFKTIVETAVDTCREELRDDVFGNFRLEACVDKKVTAALEAVGSPALNELASRNPQFLLVAFDG